MNKLFSRYSLLVFYLSSSMLLMTTEGSGQTLAIGGGNRTLTITTGIAGGQLVSIVNTNCTLTYTTPLNPNVRWRITVSTACVGQSFNLSVVAINVTQGTAAPEVTLSNGSPAIDFITNIRRNRSGSCRLQYTASATFAQGSSAEVGNDVHTVTYTLIEP